MSARILGGEPEVAAALAALLTAASDGSAGRRTLLSDRAGRRSLLRATLPSGERLFVKRSYAAGARHPHRERWKGLARLAAADREWRALVRLHRAGVAVPEPRARLDLPNGDRVIASTWIDGRLLRDAPRDHRARRKLLREVGDRIAGLHAAGVVHGDLHAGNILVGDAGPVLVDLGASRRSRARWRRLRDLGDLDHSLEPWIPLTDRVRLRAESLGLARPFDAAARGAIAAVAQAARRRARVHATSRTRRCLSEGRRFAAFSTQAGRGLRLREIADAALREALATRGDAAEILKSDRRSRVTRVRAGGRRLVVKEWPDRGLRRALADALRGSPARRSWRGGHGLVARGVGVARPLAFLERRTAGLPVSSLVVLEDLSAWRPADTAGPVLAGPDELARALAALATRLHARGALHGDFKASHVWLARIEGRLWARLLDLESVRFPRRLSDGARVRALAQLNASVPDSLPAAPRRRALAFYAALLPFAGLAPDTAALEIARRSVARGHRWSGTDCQALTSSQRK